MSVCRFVVRGLAVLLVTAGVGACERTATQKLELAPEEIRAEEAKQRELALRSHVAHKQRLLDVAYPILRSGVPLCERDVVRGAGLIAENLHDYQAEWRETAERALGLGERLRVVAVAEGSPAREAGIEVGDVLLEIRGQPIPPGEDAERTLDDHLRALSDSDAAEVELLVGRNGTEVRIATALDRVCGYPVEVKPSDDRNAYADGRTIFVTASLMRFADDQELGAIVAHELAHNGMGHIGKWKRNGVLGAVLGAVASAAAFGHHTAGAYMVQGAKLGLVAYSQDYETEADYVGLYAMALAGLELEAALTFWRHSAQASPQTIGLASTHPTTVERFLRIEKGIEEIRWKQELGLPLRPNPRRLTAPGVRAWTSSASSSSAVLSETAP